jgi:hypothetical protein
MSIQNEEPTFAALGEYQLEVATLFSVAAPLPASASGVVPLQFGDCTFDPVNVIVPDPSTFAPPESLEMLYVPVTLYVVPVPPLIPTVIPPAVMLAGVPVAVLKEAPAVPPV